MNDRQLLSFIKIAETGSFSKAARDSFISVPAIVQQIDRLEETLGFRLFSRNNQGAELTPDGKIFYEAALEMQRTYEEAVLKIKSQREITIGVAPNQCPEFLLDACAAFQEPHPTASGTAPSGKNGSHSDREAKSLLSERSGIPGTL